MPNKEALARRSAKKKKKKKLSFSRVVLLAVILVGIVLAFVGCGYMAGAVYSLPEWDPQKLEGSESTIIYDREGQPASRIYSEENRTPVILKDLPPYLPDAFVAIEDHRFFSHHGVDVEAVGRAFVANIKGGIGAEGGSTITQQLVKNSFLTPEKTFKRKIQEAILALQVEHRYSKDEILEFYLNRIYFGDGTYGIQTASQHYFDKSADELSLAESALLAGIVRSPNNYNPNQSKEVAKKRQELVLNTMAKNGNITQQEAEQAKQEELQYKEGATASYSYPYFTDHVISETEKILQKQGVAPETCQALIYRGGLKVYTSLNPQVQQKMEDVFSNSANFPKDQKDKQVQGAMVLLEHRTGEIQALVGGRKHTQQRSFNRATQAKRQPGSAIKPLVVFAPALEKGYSPALSLLDAPVTIGKDTFHNFDRKYSGWITMRTAVQWSKNTYAVRLLHNLGIDYGLEFAKKLGISSFDPRDRNLSLALGGITYGISPLEMAGAFGAIANQGVFIEPHSVIKIVDRNGTVIYDAHPQKRVAMSEQTAYIMTDLLQTVVKSGTGTRAQLNRPVAGKTGTTEHTKDIWFMGYTPEFTGAVWMGFDQEETMGSGAAGGTYPALIWKAIMQKATEGIPVRNFQKPSGITTTAICTKSGKLANAFCPDTHLLKEVFVDGSLPRETCDLHVQAEICADTKLLANPYCPHKIKAVFLKGEKTENGLPKEVCTKHGPEDEQEEISVKVCTDPRHNGVLYLANIPGLLETGGCPHEFIEERKFKVGEAPKTRCPLQDHMVEKKSLFPKDPKEPKDPNNNND
ncbi:MAG TPA: penicillin-binding protein 1A [Syntrophomonadaceae bacterium]|nr:penicillin-binding protein 1A [Syntrophomonadaceae bacterium]